MPKIQLFLQLLISIILFFIIFQVFELLVQLTQTINLLFLCLIYFQQFSILFSNTIHFQIYIIYKMHFNTLTKKVIEKIQNITYYPPYCVYSMNCYFKNTKQPSTLYLHESAFAQVIMNNMEGSISLQKEVSQQVQASKETEFKRKANVFGVESTEEKFTGITNNFTMNPQTVSENAQNVEICEEKKKDKSLSKLQRKQPQKNQNLGLLDYDSQVKKYWSQKCEENKGHLISKEKIRQKKK